MPEEMAWAVASANQGGGTMMAIRVMGSIALAAATAIALVEPPTNGKAPVKEGLHTAGLSGSSKEIVPIALVSDIGERASNASPCGGRPNDARTWMNALVGHDTRMIDKP